MAEFEDKRDADAQRYADRLLGTADWTLPFLTAACYTSYLRPDQIRAEFLGAYQNRVSTAYQPVGPMLECFQNVRRQVQNVGGGLVLGWQITPHMRWDEGVHLEAHAIWRTPDEQLIEVTAGRPTWEFAPSALVQFGDRIVITSQSKLRANEIMKQTKYRSTQAIWEQAKNPVHYALASGERD